MSRRSAARRSPASNADAPFRSRSARARPGGGPRRGPGSPIPNGTIVYSAETYGRYLAAGNRPSGFGHWRQISRLLVGGSARSNRAAAAQGGAGDDKMMLYTIGVSFSDRDVRQGASTRTRFGRLFEWIGGHESANDRYNAEAWQRYGAFMHQTPWYAFPFGQALGGLWRTSSGAAP